jgi:DNA-binding transcriptional ArsR family regulator
VTGEPLRDLQAASDLLKALASPVRLGIVRELSQHLRVLRNSRIVTTRRQAREVQYCLTDDHVAHIVLDAIRHAQE